MKIKEIIFHSTKEAGLLRQINKAKEYLYGNLKINVLDTPKSTAQNILLQAGITNYSIYDFNEQIQTQGLKYSQDWIDFIFSQNKLPIWNSFNIRNSHAKPFQYSSLLNRNREIRYLYDDIIRLYVISEQINKKHSCLVVSTDPFFLKACVSLGFAVIANQLQKKVFLKYVTGFITGLLKRMFFVLTLLFLKFNTRKYHGEILSTCASENNTVWVSTTFFPGLVSPKTGHDARYKDVVKNIENETGTVMVYAGWVTMSKDLFRLKQYLSNIISKGTNPVFVSNLLPIKIIIGYILPTDILGALKSFLKNKQDLDQSFLHISMYHFLEREFFTTYLCMGNPNESFYYYRLVENSYLHLLKKFKPKLVTTFLEGYNFGRSVISACRHLNVPVFGWQESVFHPMRLYYRWSYESLEKDLYSKNTKAEYLYPDGFCVWSDDDRDFLVANKMSKERIVVIGATRYRGFIKRILESNYNIQKTDPKNILVAGTAFLNESIALRDFVEEAVSGLDKFKVVFRPHPRYKKLFFDGTTIKISGGSLADDLKWAGVVISSWSTLLCEAFLLGKACVSVFTAGWVSQPPLPDKICNYFTSTFQFRNWLMGKNRTEVDPQALWKHGTRLLGDPSINPGKKINDFIKTV